MPRISAQTRQARDSHNRTSDSSSYTDTHTTMASYSSARDLLREVVSRYRALASYADTGCVQDLSNPKFPPISFETALRRPDEFRFRFSSAHPFGPKRHLISRSQVGLNAGKPYIWSQHYSAAPELEHAESLCMAIAGATGISRGSAFTIWSLLFDDDDHNLFSTLTRPRFRRFASLDGVRCHRVTVTHIGFHRIDIYIGVADLLLRGWVTRSMHHPHAEIRTNIKVGIELDDSFFDIPDEATHPTS